MHATSNIAQARSDNVNEDILDVCKIYYPACYNSDR